jgi:flagellar basal-body rod protein FlgG
MELRDAIPVDSIALAQQSQVRSLKLTGDALDIATEGGTFLLQTNGIFHPANSAQLHRDRDGRLVDSSGAALQAVGGGDLVIGPGSPTILRDGTILIDGQAAGRIGVFAVDRGDDEPVSVLPDAADKGVVRQGYLFPSDVDSAGEMVELTKASRLAETGARLFQIYDDLTGRVSSKLGELGR